MAEVFADSPAGSMPASPLRHPLVGSVEGSLEDVRAALIGRDSKRQSAGNCHQLATDPLANQIERRRLADTPPHPPADISEPHGRLSLTSKSFVNDLVNRSLQMVNLNSNAHSDQNNIDATPIMSLEEHEPRSFEQSLESSPEPPELEKPKMKKSASNLNPVGPMEFLERYRTRNSSQRPLVSESFSSAKASPFCETGSTIELKNPENVDMICPETPDSGATEDMPERGQW